MKYNPSCATGGTAVDTLQDEAMVASDALREAISALVAMYPNSRDYGDNYPNATNEHNALVTKVQSVLLDIETRIDYLDQKRAEQPAQRAG